MNIQRNSHVQQTVGGVSRQDAASSGDSGIEPDSGGLGDLFRMLRQRLHLIVGATVLALLGGLIFLLLASPKYTATAQLLIETRQPNIVSSLTLFPGLTSDAPLIESQVELIRANEVLDRAITTLKLVKAPDVIPSEDIKEGKDAKGPEGAPLIDEESENLTGPTIEEVRRKFVKRIDVQRKGLTYIILVHYTDANAIQAARGANAIATSFIAYQGETRRRMAQRANEWLVIRLEQLRHELRIAEVRVQDFKEKHGFQVIGGTTLADREIADTVNQISQARTKEAGAFAQLQQVEKLVEEPDRLLSMGDVLQSEVIRDLRNQHSGVQRKLITTSSLYGDQNTEVVSIREELDNIEKAIKSEVGRIVSRSRNDYEISKAQVKTLEDQLKSLQESVAERNRLLVSLAELERQANSLGKLYESFLTRAKETQSQESFESADASIVSQAVAPPQPSFPVPGLTLAIALVGGLGLGTFGALLLGQLRPLINTPADVEKHLGMRTLVCLPPVVNRHWRSHYQRHKPMLPDRHIVKLPESEFTQGIFSLQNLIRGLDGQRSLKVITLIAVNDPEPKSNVALNLADYSALVGRKTLLLDCNFREPLLTKRLSPAPGHSIADALAEPDKMSAFAKMLEPTGLQFCPAPASGTVARPMDVLSSPEMKRLIETAREKWDLTIIDSLPLSRGIDSQGLAQISDLVICVIDCGRVTPRDAIDALERARIPRGVLTAAVLTNCA